MADTLDTLIVICEEATEPRDIWRNRAELLLCLRELRRNRGRIDSDERALAVCFAALESTIEHIARPENVSDSIKYALERGEAIVAKREEEAQDADRTEG